MALGPPLFTWVVLRHRGKPQAAVPIAGGLGETGEVELADRRRPMLVSVCGDNGRDGTGLCVMLSPTWPKEDATRGHGPGSPA